MLMLPVKVKASLANQRFQENDALQPDWRLVLVHQVIPKRTFYRRQWQISLPFHILQQVNSVTFHIIIIIWSLKKVPLSGRASLYRPLSGVTRGFPSQGKSYLLQYEHTVALTKFQAQGEALLAMATGDT